MANRIGLVRGTIKYGYQRGPRTMVGECLIGASETFNNKGGKFVTFDASRRIEVAVAGSTHLFGWFEGGEFTSSSTEGGSWGMVDVSPWSIYRIPADAAVNITMRGKTCDLIVTNGVQMADVGASLQDVITIVDVDIANQCVYVRINWAKQYNAGVI